jgi:triosephosphate isomerase
MTTGRRTPLIAGNWKMHGSLAESQKLVEAVRDGAEDLATRVLLCPPYVYLPSASAWLRGSRISLGAQDCAEQQGQGAFTGEVSGRMLRDVGCEYVIVGHSERRALFGDDDRRVAAKFMAAQAESLVPILCVGETQAEREQGRTEAVVSAQLKAVLDAAGVAAFGRAVVAYEPVWAIGTGLTASPAQAQDVHAMIRAMIGALDGTIAAGLTVLYGGSVKGSNARELLAMDDIDGGLIGGASLKAEEFLAICRAALG